MPGPAARRVHLAPPVREELETIARSGTYEHRLLLRARIILLAAAGVGNAEIARQLGTTDRTACEWRRRFCEDPRSETLEDRPRSGRPPVIPLEARLELIKLACSRPEGDLAPFRETWTLGALGAALNASSEWDLSTSEIHRILNAEEIRPHRIRYWLHSPDPEFRAKVKRICSLYTNLPEGATLVCIDEKTCIQALHRRRRLVCPTRGRPGRFEYEYRRRGTTNLLAAFEPQTGQVFGVCRPRRKAEDLMAFMELVAGRYPEGEVYVVWDNLNIHKGDRWKEFNDRHGGRFHFVYTPLHASWVNQIEIWFGILQRRVLKLGVFRSVDELVAAVLGFIEHWNVGEAHPFSWAFRGWRRNIRARRAA